MSALPEVTARPHTVLLAARRGGRTRELIRCLLGIDSVPVLASSRRHAEALAGVLPVDAAVIHAGLVDVDHEVAHLAQGLAMPIVVVGDPHVAGVPHPAATCSLTDEPFEVALRVQALLRQISGGVLRYGPLELDLRRHEGSWEGEPLHLSPTQFRILGVLARAGGDVVSRGELCRRAMGSHGPGDTERLDAQLRRIRSRLEARGDEGPFLVTVRGEGIRLDHG